MCINKLDIKGWVYFLCPRIIFCSCFWLPILIFMQFEELDHIGTCWIFSYNGHWPLRKWCFRLRDTWLGNHRVPEHRPRPSWLPPGQWRPGRRGCRSGPGRPSSSRHQCCRISSQFLKFDLQFCPSAVKYWLNYWHTLISKDMSGFTSNTLLIRIQYCHQFI